MLVGKYVSFTSSASTHSPSDMFLASPPRLGPPDLINLILLTLTSLVTSLPLVTAAVFVPTN